MEWMDWKSLGGVKYRAAYPANEYWMIITKYKVLKVQVFCFPFLYKYEIFLANTQNILMLNVFH